MSLKKSYSACKKTDPMKCVKCLVMFVIIITIIFVRSQRIFHVQFPFNNMKIRFINFFLWRTTAITLGKIYVEQQTVKMFLWKGSARSSKISLRNKFLNNSNNFFNDFFCPGIKKNLFRRILTVCTTYIEKTFLFLFQLQICGRSSACRKKIRCRRMDPVPPFWDICQWQNFLGNLNTWPNTSSKRFSLLPFL